RPVDQVAMVTRRHMHRYGTTSAHLAAVAIACRSHATRNPAALMRAPLTVAEHQASRVVSDPLRLLDCCLENDAGAAFVVVPAERAADLRQRAVYVRATAQGTGGLPEGYIQGMNLVAEAVRQLRGTSTCQVPEAALALVAGATTVPTSALLLGRDP